MKKVKWLILFVLAALLILPALPLAAAEKQAEVWVDVKFTGATAGWNVTHFDTIQNGVDAAAENGTVYVAAGTYNKKVEIDTTGITIYGEPGVILDGTDVPDVNGFYISGGTSAVTIEGFTIINWRGYGIYINAVNNTVTNNTIADNNGGIWALPGNEIHYNNIIDNVSGVVNEEASANVDATMNWWGHVGGPTHDGNIFGLGDIVSNNVGYDPWLADEDADYSEGTRVTPVANGVSVSLLGDDFAFPIIITITTGQTDGWVAFMVCDPDDHEGIGIPPGVKPLPFWGYHLAYVECSENLKGQPVKVEMILAEDINELEDFDVDKIPPDLIKLYRFEDGSWNLLGGELLVENDKLIFRVEFTGLSLFGLFERELSDGSGTSKTLPRTGGALPLTGLACMAMLVAGTALLHRKKR